MRIAHTPTESPPLVEILVMLLHLSGGRESTSPLGYSWGAVIPCTPNTSPHACANAHSDTHYIVMREGDGTKKATAGWNLLTKDWPVVQGRQQLSGELISQHWSEGCTAEAAHADGTAKTDWLNTTVASALLLYGKKSFRSFISFFFQSLFVCHSPLFSLSSAETAVPVDWNSEREGFVRN